MIAPFAANEHPVIAGSRTNLSLGARIIMDRINESTGERVSVPGILVVKATREQYVASLGWVVVGTPRNYPFYWRVATD